LSRFSSLGFPIPGDAQLRAVLDAAQHRIADAEGATKAAEERFVQAERAAKTAEAAAESLSRRLAAVEKERDALREKLREKERPPFSDNSAPTPSGTTKPQSTESQPCDFLCSIGIR
jgi:hypothetical protein